MTVLVTLRLRLRPAASTDLAALHGILSDPEAMRYWSSLPHESPEQTRLWLEAMIATRPPDGEDWVIEHQGIVIGKAGLNRFPEVGFILHPNYWGRGFAREALAPILARAFGVHALPAVTADVDPRNAASLSLLTQLGFVETGRAERTLQLGGEWCDSIYLKLTPAALLRAAGSAEVE